MPTLTVDQVIVRPLITEKNTDLMEQDQYTFEVATVANKIQIREGREALQRAGQGRQHNERQGLRRSRAIRRGRSRIYGQERAWKKAVVTLFPASARRLRTGLAGLGDGRQG